MKTKVNISYT